MSLLNDRKTLLWLVAVLLIAKFIVMPVIEWQNSTLSEIHSLTKRLKKADALIANFAYLNQANQELTQALEQQRTWFFQGSESTQTQLQQLREIEGLAQKNQLNIVNSRWLGSQHKQGYTEHRLELGINGELVNVIQLISDIESQKKPRRFDSWSVNIRGMSKNSIGRVVNGKLVLQILVQDTAGEQNAPAV
jgi:hypothetical protein